MFNPDQAGRIIAPTKNNGVLTELFSQSHGIFQFNIGDKAAFLKGRICHIRPILPRIGFVISFNQHTFEL